MVELSITEIRNYCRDVYTNCVSKYPTYAAFFKMLQRFGFRPIELIELSRWTIVDDFTIDIDTAKNSNNRNILIADTETDTLNRVQAGDDYYFKQFLSLPPLFGSISSINDNYILIYNALVNIFKLVRPFRIYVGTSKDIGMNIFRHNRIKQLYYVDRWTVQQISDWIGEADNNNTSGYINSTITKD